MVVAQCKPHYLFLFTPKAKPHMMHKSTQITRDTVPLKIAIFKRELLLVCAVKQLQHFSIFEIIYLTLLLVLLYVQYEILFKTKPFSQLGQTNQAVLVSCLRILFPLKTSMTQYHYHNQGGGEEIPISCIPTQYPGILMTNRFNNWSIWYRDHQKDFDICYVLYIKITSHQNDFNFC